MIKWVGFGKLLKQFFFILLISCFIFLGNSYVKADNFQFFPVGIDKVQSYWNTQYEVGFLPKGRFLSMYLGTSKPLISLDSQYLIWWGSNGGLYLYYNSPSSKLKIIQGFFQYVSSCDSLGSTSGGSLQNCTSPTQVGITSDIVSNFMSQIKQGDLIYIDDNLSYLLGCGSYCTYDYYNISVCFSSDSIGKTLCFRGDYGNYYGNSTPLTQSQNLDSSVNFANIPRSYLSEPPGFTPGIVDGGSQNVSDSSTITGNVAYSTCTNERALSWYHRKGYNDNLCYSSYDNLTEIYHSGQSYGAFAIPGIDIEEIRLDTAGYRRYGLTGSGLPYEDWFQYWRKSRDVYKHSNGEISNPFEGVPVSLFTFMGNINSYGMAFNNASILEFCDLLLYKYSTGVYNGIASDYICNVSAIDIVADSLGVHAESGQIVQGSSWEGITNRTSSDGSPTVLPQWGSGYTQGQSTSGLSFFSDGKTFENNFFNLLTNSFKYPNGGGNGILPGYIVLALCGLILFRFLRH